jgi:hypothetical protein
MLKLRIPVVALAAFLLVQTPSNHAQATPFEVGQFGTFSQDSWGTLGSAASSLLVNSFFTVYLNGVEIGISGIGGNSAIFNTPEAILDYLPTSGSPDALDNDLQDPMSTSAGAFGGNVLALQLDVDFDDANLLGRTSALAFRNLVLSDLDTLSRFHGLTVGQVLAVMNRALGADLSTVSDSSDFDRFDSLARALTESFEAGTPSQFAQDHLQIPPHSVPDPATLALVGLGLGSLSFARRPRVNCG